MEISFLQNPISCSAELLPLSKSNVVVSNENILGESYQSSDENQYCNKWSPTI